METSTNNANRFDSLIASRFEERTRKLNLISQWEKEEQAAAPRRRFMRRLSIAVSSIAAALIVAVAVNFYFLTREANPIDVVGIEMPGDMEVWRGPYLEPTWNAQKLIEAGDYHAALKALESLLRESDNDLRELTHNLTDFEADEIDFEIQTEKYYNAAVRWRYIYVLTKLERYSDAERQLVIYLRDPDCIAFSKEARALLSEIRNR